MLVVSLCKPVTHKLKMLGGGELEHYKSMGGTTKRGDKILEFQWGGWGGMTFYSNLVGGILEENMLVL